MPRRRKSSDVRKIDAVPAPPVLVPSGAPILGHTRVLERLRVYHDTQWRGGVMLWAGPEGVGKRTIALRFAQGRLCTHHTFLGCGTCAPCRMVERGQHPDLVVYMLNGQSTHRVETVWRYREQIALRSWSGGVKIFIWDDVDRMRQEAANAMLKTLEEPPPDAITILITAQLYRILPTIRSRSQILRFGPVPEEDLLRYLLRQPEWSESEARWACRFSQGRPGWIMQPRAFWDFHRQLRRIVLEWLQKWLADPHEEWWRYMEVDVRPLETLARDVFSVQGPLFTGDGWVWHRWWVEQILTHALILVRDLWYVQQRLHALIISIDLQGTLERMADWVSSDRLLTYIERWTQFLYDMRIYHFSGAWQFPGHVLRPP